MREKRSERRDGGKVIDAAVTISGTSLRRTDVGSFSKKRNKKHERGRDGGGARGKRRHADIADTASRSSLPGRGWGGGGARRGTNRLFSRSLKL